MTLPLSLDALRVLDAIARRGSFAAAAEELFHVPSAISYTVARLEEELGVALFDRSRRRAELTPAGRLVLEHGRRILLAADELAAMARQLAQGWETTIGLCVDSVLEAGPVYALIREFHTLQPRIEVRLSEEVLGGSWDALDAGRCDIVLGAEGQPPGQGFATAPLGQVEFVFAVAPGHPLTSLPEPLPLAAIADHPTVVVADSSRRLPVRSAGLLDGRSRLVVPSIGHKIEAQCLGLGVGYLPRHRIAERLAAGQLRVLELAHPRPPQQISLAWRSGGRGKASKWFVDRLRGLRFDAEHGLRAG